ICQGYAGICQGYAGICQGVDALVSNQVFQLIKLSAKVLHNSLASAITASLTLMKMTRVR
ncbi:MAG: hypothetical protein ACOYLI_12035, partial [Synechococcus lacustris]